MSVLTCLPPTSLAGPVAATVLVVDDSLIDRRVAGRVIERLPGWRAEFAADGAEALATMARSAPAVVLTDLLMPELDGLGLVERARRDFPHVPVILMTNRGSEELAVKALRHGAASYVAKRNLARDLPATLEQVLAASRTDVKRQRMLACLSQRDSRFNLENDPALIPPLVADVREDLVALRLCDTAGAARVGIALEAALHNAIVHGNLGLTAAYRRLPDEEFARQLGERRLTLPYRDRRVRLLITLTPAEATFLVHDQGGGFDTSYLPVEPDPTTLADGRGRGLVLMQTLLDRVTCSKAGNQVTLVKYRQTGGGLCAS